MIKLNFKTRLKYQFILTLNIYIVSYLITSFVTWQFRNPFLWIIDLPTYDWSCMGCIVMSLIIYFAIVQGMVIPLWIDSENQKKIEQNKQLQIEKNKEEFQKIAVGDKVHFFDAKAQVSKTEIVKFKSKEYLITQSDYFIWHYDYNCKVTES